jgi:hypothetical protein
MPANPLPIRLLADPLLFVVIVVPILSPQKIKLGHPAINDTITITLISGNCQEVSMADLIWAPIHRLSTMWIKK